jgi:hypothetical protein
MTGVKLNSESNKTDALVDLASESWRLARQFLRAIDLKEASLAQRQAGQVRYFQRRLDDILSTEGLRIVDLEGQDYDVGMAMTALNSADFGPEDGLIVDQMIEPTIMDAGGVRRVGTGMLRKR